MHDKIWGSLIVADPVYNTHNKDTNPHCLASLSELFHYRITVFHMLL